MANDNGDPTWSDIWDVLSSNTLYHYLKCERPVDSFEVFIYFAVWGVTLFCMSGLGLLAWWIFL